MIIGTGTQEMQVSPRM